MAHENGFGRKAWKVGATALVGSLAGGALLRNTNWGPTMRAFAGLGGGILAGALVGGRFPNVGLGLIAAGGVVGGGFGMQAVAQSGLLTPTSASSTTGTTGTTTGTTTTTSGTTTSTAGGALGLGDGAARGLGAGRPLVNFQKVPAMTVPHIAAGKRIR